MNLGDLRKLVTELEGEDDELPVINQIYMEQGRGGSGGVDYEPSMNLEDVGDSEHQYSEANCDEPDNNWVYDEEEFNYTNKKKWIVIQGSCDEDWCE